MPDRLHLLLPASVGARIINSGAPWGGFGVRRVVADDLLVIVEYEVQGRGHREVSTAWLDEHCSRGASVQHGVGFWYRGDEELHAIWDFAWRRRVSIGTDLFRKHINGWRQPGRIVAPVITYANTRPDLRRWCGWAVSAEWATPITIELVDESANIYATYAGAWPLEIVAPHLVTVVGVGSLGSAAAEALLEYGIRRLALVDYDRLQFHNLARHQLLARDIGRFKVNAMKELLHRRDPEAQIDALTLDVVEDADRVRPLFNQTSVIVVCSDGVASRRAANHLACWARTPIIFACVLENGGIGELLRVKPGVSACLTCYRDALVEAGSFDPEPDLDLGYGTGSRHLPMTAVGGDLDLVGKLAAKTAVATLLERAGYIEQWLPAGHAVIGLHPPPSMPAPFDVQRAGELKWNDIGRPRPGCPSCRPV